MIAENIAETGLYHTVVVNPEMCIIPQRLVIYSVIVRIGAEHVMINQRYDTVKHCKEKENRCFGDSEFYIV